VYLANPKFILSLI